MFKPDNIPPLPIPDDYTAAAHRVAIQLSGDNGALGRELTNIISMDSAYKNFSEETTALARCVEPVDRSTGEFIDPEEGTARAFHSGIGAGLLLARQVHGSQLMPRRLFNELTLDNIELDPSDMLQRRHDIAEAISEMGYRGLQLLGNKASEQVEAWSERFIIDVTKQRMFTVGAGVLVLTGYQQHEANLNKFHREAMETLASSVHDVDWDYQLTELLEGRA